MEFKNGKMELELVAYDKIKESAIFKRKNPVFEKAPYIVARYPSFDFKNMEVHWGSGNYDFDLEGAYKKF